MVPVPALWVKLAAVTAPVKVVLAPLFTVRAPSLRVLPTGPVTLMLPPPATRVRPWILSTAGSTVPLNPIPPVLPEVSMATLVASTTGPVKETEFPAVLSVVISPLRVILSWAVMDTVLISFNEPPMGPTSTVSVSPPVAPALMVTSSLEVP